MAASKREAVAMAATVALAGLAARVDAPPFPGDSAGPEAVQEWIVDIMKRVGDRMPSANDLAFLRYLLGDFDRPNSAETHRKLSDLIQRLEKGRP